jgi:hypothetical protein
MDEDAEPREESEDEASDDDASRSSGDDETAWSRSLLRQSRSEFAAALLKNGVPAELAATLTAGLRTVESELSDDGCETIRTAEITTALALAPGAPGLELRFSVHNRCRAYSVEFFVNLHWRPTAPVPEGHPMRRDGWVCLGRAWLADVPSSSHDDNSDGYGFSQGPRSDAYWVAVEKHQTRGMTADAVAAIRAALFRGNAEAAAVPNAALVPALLAAAGCKLTDIGHVWQPSDDLKEAARAAGHRRGRPPTRAP